MALVVKSAVTMKADGSELYIEFVNATGTYDVSTNPGGFDTPNPSRNSLAAILVAKHQLVAGDEDANIQAYNVISVESFTIALTKEVNGVLKYDILLVPIFDDNLTYEDDDVTYDNTTNPTTPVLQIMVEGEWVETTAEALIGNADVSQNNDYAFPTPDAIALEMELLGVELQKLVEHQDGNCQCEDYEPVRNQYEFVRGLNRTACDAFRAGAFNEAQKKIEKIFDFESTVLDAE